MIPSSYKENSKPTRGFKKKSEYLPGGFIFLMHKLISLMK